MELRPPKRLEKTEKLEKTIYQKRVAEPVGGQSIRSRVASSLVPSASKSGDPEPLWVDDFKIMRVGSSVASAFEEVALSLSVPSSLPALLSP